MRRVREMIYEKVRTWKVVKQVVDNAYVIYTHVIGAKLYSLFEILSSKLELLIFDLMVLYV